MNLLALLLLLVSLVLDLLIGQRHLGLQGRNALNLSTGHPDSRTDTGGLFENLCVLLLAVLNETEFLFISALEGVVDVLVLLPESLKVLVAHDLLKELLEVTFDILELVLLHAHRLDFLLEFLFVLDRFVVHVAVFVSQISHLKSSYIIYC